MSQKNVPNFEYYVKSHLYYVTPIYVGQPPWGPGPIAYHSHTAAKVNSLSSNYLVLCVNFEWHCML